MVQLIPTLLEYLLMWLLQLIQLRLKDVSAPSVTINAQQTAAPASATLQPTCAVATGTITVAADWNWNHSINGSLIPTLLEYLLMWLLQRIQLRLKCCRCISAQLV
jgi:hypothetical protein